MPDRSSARWLAPLALVATLVVVLALIAGTSGDEEPTGGTAGVPATTGTGASTSAEGGGGTSTGERRARTTATTGGGSGDGPKTYTVQAGDNFSTISQRTGVSVERLRELNPDLDPQALNVGDEVRLRP